MRLEAGKNKLTHRFTRFIGSAGNMGGQYHVVKINQLLKNIRFIYKGVNATTQGKVLATFSALVRIYCRTREKWFYIHKEDV